MSIRCTGFTANCGGFHEACFGFDRIIPLIDPNKAGVGYLGGLPALR